MGQDTPSSKGMRKRIDFAKMVLTSQDLTMKNSFVLVQWHGESSVRGNLIDDLKSDTRETASVTDNRFKIIIAMKLFVGNLPFDITERTLRELFEPFGTVSEVKLIMDRETGQYSGFGFVTIDNVSEGNAAIKGLHGKDKGGQQLHGQ